MIVRLMAVWVIVTGRRRAAAILVHGTSLPPDRALWPSYMSGGSLASPKLSGTGLPRIANAASSRHIGSPAATVSSFARDEPPSSRFGDEELEGVNQIEEDDEDAILRCPHQRPNMHPPLLTRFMDAAGVVRSVIIPMARTVLERVCSLLRLARHRMDGASLANLENLQRPLEILP
ncbi:11212_t:CDS:2, partial [Acaulospora colombiana]